MKRVVISGFACPAHSWKEFLGPDTTVISLHDVLEATKSPDVKKWSRFIDAELDRLKPDSLICHDYGGIMSLLALWHREKKGKVQPKTLTILNTAFKDFNVYKNPHPFTVQLMSWDKLTKAVQVAGGHVDPALKPYFGTIKGTYRRVIAGSTARQIFGLIKPNFSLSIRLSTRTQVLASSNDPFIAIQNMENIQKDFTAEKFVTIDYGHFPYSSPAKAAVLSHIHQFEKLGNRKSG